MELGGVEMGGKREESGTRWRYIKHVEHRCSVVNRRRGTSSAREKTRALAEQSSQSMFQIQSQRAKIDSI